MRKFIVYWILYFFNLLFKWLKIKKNRITFISYKSNKLEKDFKLISKALEKEKKYELIYILTKYENNLLGNIKYLYNCILQLYYTNTSVIIILDYNNFVISNFKKAGVKVIQIWHASGAIKKFGNDIEREYLIQNYDYVISTSEYWSNIYSQAFNVKKENILPLGLPRTDALFSKEKLKKYKKEILLKYPEIKDKKVILYAPTFRGKHIKGAYIPQIDLKYIKNKIGDDYAIIYKFHPWNDSVDIGENKGIINGNKEVLIKLFSVADYLISDYSSIIYDFTILGKPVISFVPDIEEYRISRGFYEDYEKTMPWPICKSENEVVDAILSKKINLNDIIEFNNRYFKYTDGKSIERILSFINNLI